MERHLHGQIGIVERNFRQRIFAGESSVGQSCQARDLIWTQTAAGFVWRHEPRLQNANHRLGLSHLDPDAGKRVADRFSFIRAVKNLPVEQLAAAAEGNTTRRDSAQWECDLIELTLGEGSRVLD